MNPFYNFLNQVSKRVIKSRITEVAPNLYNQIPEEIHQAILDEISSYNLTKDKKDVIRAKLEGAIAATFTFDEEFLDQLVKAPDDSQRIFLIRKYLREYVKKEINLETANLIREARNKIISQETVKAKSLLSVLDPRWKKKANPGDYSQYDDYRKNVTGLLFPEGGGLREGEGKASKSQFTLNAESEVQKYNEQLSKLKAEGKAGPAGSFNRLKKEKELKNNLIKKFDALSDETQVYSHDFKGFLTLRQQVILNNIEKHRGIKPNLSIVQKIELLKAIENKDISVATKFLKIDVFKGLVRVSPQQKRPDKKLIDETREEFNETFEEVSKVVDKLSEVGHDIVFKSDGTAQLKGSDDFQNLLESGITGFGDKVTKDSSKAIVELQTSYAVSNIATLKALIQKEKAVVGSPPLKVDPALTDLLAKNQFVLDVLNLSKALKDASKLTGVSSSNLGAVKSRVLNAVNTGAIKFASEGEKVRFVQAIQENNGKYLKKFVTPGLIGAGSFAKLVAEINTQSLNIAGSHSSPTLASNALNFSNNVAVYKQNVLNSYIYAAQIGFDQGYAVSEIKKRLNQNKYVQLFKTYSTPITWEAVKEKVSFKFKQGVVSFALKSAKYFGIKTSAKDIESIEAIFEYFSGKKTAGDLLKTQGAKIFKTILEKLGGKAGVNLKLTWKNIANSALFKSGKLALLKNLKSFEKISELALKKLAGRLPGITGKLVASGWSVATRYLAKYTVNIGKWFSFLIKPKNTTEEIERVAIAVVAFFVLPIVIIYLVGTLIPMMVLIGANNNQSVQNTTYQEGAVSDVLFATYQEITPNIVVSPISADISACMNPSSNTYYPGYLNKKSGTYVNWNNLKLADFVGTDNTNNCKIMCNARRYLGGLSPNSEGSINCNINRVLKEFQSSSEVGSGNQYVCADLILDSYRDDDPEMSKINNARLVIAIDDYLKKTTDKYDRLDLAIPNDPNSSDLSSYKYNCVDPANFKPGNILIIRANTCNDVYENGRYRTLDSRGIKSRVYGAHIELVLKVEGGNTKYLVTVNANNVKKLVRHPMKPCDSDPTKYRLEIQENGTSFRGTAEDGTQLNGSYAPGFLCRIYQLKDRPNPTCFDKCNIMPNNYPDASDFIKP